MRPIRRLAAAFALAAAVAAAMPVAAQLMVTRRADLATPVALGPGQGAIVVGFRRPDRMSMGKSGVVAFARYDPVGRDLVPRPRDAKKTGDTRTYAVAARSGDKTLALDHAVMIVSAGDYVLAGASPGPVAIPLDSFCLGTPTFRVGAGEVVYFGDVTPYIGVKLVGGARGSAMAYSAHPEDARRALDRQPALAAALRPAELRNGATFTCAAQALLAYAVPGAPPLDPDDGSAATAPRR